MAADHADGFEELSPGEAALFRDAAKAERYQAMRDRGRQIGGVPGAMVAGLMIALRDIYDPSPKRDDGIPMVEAPGDPHDVDREGMDFAAGDIGGSDDVTVAALERRPPIVAGSRAAAAVPPPLTRSECLLLSECHVSSFPAGDTPSARNTPIRGSG